MRAASFQKNGGAVTAWISLALFLLAAAAAGYRFYGLLGGRRISGLFSAVTLSPGFLIAVALYMTSHLLRSLRLLMLLLETERSLPRVIRLHTGLAWVAMLLPFKILGDAYRMLELSHDQDRAAVGPFVVMVERFLDAAVMLGLAALAWFLSPGALPDISPLIAVLLAVAALGAALYRGLPGFLAYARSLVIRRSRSQWRRLLRWLNQLDQLMTLGHKLIHARIPVLLALSLGVWGAEWGCVSLLYRCAAGPGTGGTWLPALLNAFSSLLTAKGDLLTGFPLYGLATFLGLTAAGFPLWLAYSWLRIKSGAARIDRAAAAGRHYHLSEYRYKRRELSYGP